MPTTFQRLSDKRVKSVHTGKHVSDAKTSIEEKLGLEDGSVDIVDNGAIIADDRKLSTLKKPLQVVVHNMTRVVPHHLRTDMRDMVNDWDDDPRFLMSCGHAINPDNLYQYCWSELESQKCDFRCFASVDHGRCNWEWFFPEVSKKACLSRDEHVMFETRSNRNWVNKSAGIRECPFCLTVCERREPNNPRVTCLYCEREEEPEHDFCWFCLLPWTYDHNCSKDAARNILENCPRKEIIGLPGCPSVRACPKCNMLIEHSDACKQMKCKCGCLFCFICLGTSKNELRFKCGSYNTKCDVAPVQKV